MSASRPAHPDEPVPAPPFDAAAVARLTDGPGGEALLRRALRLFGPAGGRERSTLIAAVLREHGDKVVRELCEDALARMGSDESSAFERIATEEGAGALRRQAPARLQPSTRGGTLHSAGPAHAAQITCGQ